MAAPPAPIVMHAPEIPCCSPATTESVAVVRDKIADSRADVLVGQGAILRGQGDATSALLRDANANVLSLTQTADRNAFAAMSQTDKYGLAGLDATRSAAGEVARDVHSESDKITGQAATIAWSQSGIQGAGFAEARAQTERINDAQSAYSDRAFKYLQAQNNENFGRLGAQAENGFVRNAVAVSGVDKQVVQSEMALGRATSAGFADASATARDSYARLSEQNCQTKETVAAYGNRMSDQTATVLATLGAQHTSITRDIGGVADRLGLQAATQFGSLQLEASKNTASLQLQAALNAKESLIEQSKWFALAEKTAMVNKCDLEAKLAACCCDIKETVTGSAHATQTLIQAGERERVRDALSAATTENAILRLRREEHHHYPPYHHRERSRSPRRG